MSAPRVTGIKLDRERRLLYTFRTLGRAQTALGGMTIMRAMEGRGVTEAMALLWAGLLHEDPKLTIDGATKLADQALTAGELNLVSLWNLLGEALTNSGVLSSPTQEESGVASEGDAPTGP